MQRQRGIFYDFLSIDSHNLCTYFVCQCQGENYAIFFLTLFRIYIKLYDNSMKMGQECYEEPSSHHYSNENPL